MVLVRDPDSEVWIMTRQVLVTINNEMDRK